MKFMIAWTFKPEISARDEAIARFKKTGGQPPKGVKLLGRWTCADMSGGFDLLESDDIQALTQFALDWSDLIDHRMTPVIEDADLAAVLAKMK